MSIKGDVVSKGGGKTIVSDVRMARPIIYKVKSIKKNITLQRSEIFDIGGVEITFPTPSNVALFANIANREKQQAKNIYSSLISKSVRSNKDIDIKNEDVKRLYNYLEHIQTSIISIYTAIESFANIAIPNDYEYSFKNNKGITESYDKAAIERWLKTSEKIAKLLPTILATSSPKELPAWSLFKELENIRNDIVHQKSEKVEVADDEDGRPDFSRDINSRFIGRLLKPNIFEIVESGFDLIRFFCEKDIHHSFFPMGFSIAQLKPIEIDDFGDQFTLYRSAEEKKAKSDSQK